MSQSKHKQFRRLVRSLAEGMDPEAPFDPVEVAHQALGENSPTVRRLRGRTLRKADPRGTTLVLRTGRGVGFGGIQRMRVVVDSMLDKRAGPKVHTEGRKAGQRIWPRWVTGGGRAR